MATAIWAAVPAAHAAQWYSEPSLSISAGRDDNFTRSVTGGSAQNIFTTEPRIALGTQTENSNVLATAYLQDYRYPGREELNNTGGGVRGILGLDYERYGLDLNGGIARTVLVAYENIDVDAARAIDDTTTRTLSMNPSFRWSLNETFNLRAAVSHADVEYSGASASLYRDYRNNAPALTATYVYSEITRFFAEITDSRIEYTNTAVPLTSATISESLGVTTQLSERLDTTVSVGLRRTTTESQQPQLVCIVFIGSSCVQYTIQLVDTEAVNEGRIYNASLAWRYPVGSVTLGATQNVVPSGQAASVLGTTFSAAIRHALSPALSTYLSVTSSRYRTDQNTPLLTPSVNYDFFRVEPGLSWQIRETLTASLWYGRTRQDFVASGATTINNSTYLTLSWTPLRRYISF